MLLSTARGQSNTTTAAFDHHTTTKTLLSFASTPITENISLRFHQKKNTVCTPNNATIKAFSRGRLDLTKVTNNLDTINENPKEYEKDLRILKAEDLDAYQDIQPTSNAGKAIHRCEGTVAEVGKVKKIIDEKVPKIRKLAAKATALQVDDFNRVAKELGGNTVVILVRLNQHILRVVTFLASRLKKRLAYARVWEE